MNPADAMICTGRSDYPNQVNNVLCFPYIFRGALDVSASEINEAMKKAAVTAIAALARETPSEVAAQAYGGQSVLFGKTSLIPSPFDPRLMLRIAPRRARAMESGSTPPAYRPVLLFGKTSLIPSPFDPRLMLRIAPAVARAAMESGVAAPIADFDAYADQLNRFVFRSGFIMKPLFAKARAARKRVIYSEGEDERVLRATQVVLEEGIAEPMLIGRPDVMRDRIKRFGLTLKAGDDFEIINPEDDPRYRDYVATYLKVAGRKGVTPDVARTVVRTSPSVIGALALHRGEVDASDLRTRRTLHVAPRPHSRHRRARAGSEGFVGLVGRRRINGRLFPGRHACALRPERGRDRRDGGRLRRPCAPLRS